MDAAALAKLVGELLLVINLQSGYTLPEAAPVIDFLTHEELQAPGRVHVDPLGYVHLCQGLCLGNLFRSPLRQICSDYDPETYPVVDKILGPNAAGFTFLSSRSILSASIWAEVSWWP